MRCAAGVVAAALVFPAGIAHADVRYVDPGGSDASSGSAAAPWRHVCYGLTHVVAGDTLIVRDGSYGENCRRAGGSVDLADGPVTVIGEGQPVLRGLLWIRDADHMLKLTDGENWTWKNSEHAVSRSFSNVLIVSSTPGLPTRARYEHNCNHNNGHLSP